MSLLKSEPPAPIHSLGELFALAQLLEEEAAMRYAALAEEMDRAELPDVAAVFRHLVAEEQGHAMHVAAWARGATGTPPDPTCLPWLPPETFDEEEARQIASSRLASAYRALSMAVRNEERAFALWTYIAAETGSPQVRAAAERMAGEELQHAALLRRARRRAFHAERGTAAAERPSALLRVVTVEYRLAAMLSALAADDAVPARRSAELRQLSDAAAEMAREAAVLAGGAGPSEAPEDRNGGTSQDALRLAEFAVEAYLDAAEAGREEDRVRRLQSLAERAIARVAVLRSATGIG